MGDSAGCFQYKNTGRYDARALFVNSAQFKDESSFTTELSLLDIRASALYGLLLNLQSFSFELRDNSVFYSNTHLRF